MSSNFSTRTRRPSDPAVSVFEIFPNDNVNLDQPTTAINVATPGTVRVTTVGGSVADVQIHPGHAFPIRAERVWMTGTTATGLRGLF